ncbi:MAG: lysophospholipid acyltransferase family protein [Promethearchaeota archaeon]
MARSSSKIPLPQYKSWMHERCEIPRESRESQLKRWHSQPRPVQLLDAIVSRIMFRTRALKGHNKHVTYKFIMHFFRFYFKLFNRLKIHGVENIPKEGCIFIVNHPGSFDPLIFGASIPNMQVGAYTIWGKGWFADMLEKFYGYITRYFNAPRDVIVEKIIRQILLKNKYFAIWPEGHPHPGPIQEGFSSIIRVYGVLNHDKDRIPFLPVLIRGKGAIRKGVKHSNGPIEIYFLKPIFLPRKWLLKPESGGKTPREMIDALMLILARKNGQKSLAKNPLLERRRKTFKTLEIAANLIEGLNPLTFNEDKRNTCEKCSLLSKNISTSSIILKSIPKEFNELKEIVKSKQKEHSIRWCQSCGALYLIFQTKKARFKVFQLTDKTRASQSIANMVLWHDCFIVKN